MYIKSLKLNNFRNYHALNIDFSKNFNVLYGDNAQGKTNIIESIFLCASGRSHRTSKDIELIKFDEHGCYIKLDLVKKDANTEIEIYLGKEEKKKIKVNDVPIRKIGNLIGHINVVIFSPEDLLVIKEGPSERRRFIDITLSQLRPSYFYDLQQYAKVISQRNTLLKEVQNNKSLFDTLEVWNSNLVCIGSRLIKSRSDFIKVLSMIAKENHYKLTDRKEKLDLRYTPSIDIKDIDNTKDIEKLFLKILDASQRKEILRGTTLYGPHRDDFEIYIDDVNIKAFGSQGQQRTAVLSIKLSEIKILKEENGEYPVLLLDDVMSELDRSRQEYLFENLKNIQTFITCTDINLIKEKISGESSFYRVSNGEIIEKI